jgi:hypothetical protein
MAGSVNTAAQRTLSVNIIITIIKAHTGRKVRRWQNG